MPIQSKKTLTLDEIKCELHKLNFVMLENSYNPEDYTLKCKCPNNHNITISYYSWLNRKQKCLDCPKNRDIGKRIINIEFLKEEFERNNCILLSTKYNGYDNPLSYICKNKHNTNMSYHVWKNNKYKCVECSKISMRERFKFSYEYVKSKFEEKNFKLLSKEYSNKKDKLEYQCKNGHIDKISFDSFYFAKNECATCSNNKKHTIDDISKLLEKENYKLLSNEYINNKEKLNMMCPKKHSFEMRLNDFITGYRCKYCVESLGEQKITNFLEKCNDVEYFDSEYKFIDCKNKNQLPFDFFVNDLFLIEFDGLQHFEEIEFFGGKESFELRKNNDKIKTNYCRQKKIPLLRISYNRINEIDKIIESYMNDLKTDDTKIYFSDEDKYKYLTE